MSNERLLQLNAQFSAVFEPTHPDLLSMESQGDSASFIPPFDEAAVCRELSQIKSNASGVDGIPGLLVKKYAQLLACPLTKLFNLLYRNLTFPHA
jgi:hypothetical protein